MCSLIYPLTLILYVFKIARSLLCVRKDRLFLIKMYFQAFNPLVTDWFLMYNFSLSFCYSWPSFDRTSPKLSRSSACRCGCRRTIWVRKKYEKKCPSSLEIRQSTIYYAGLLGRWNKRIVDQESELPSIFFFMISCKILCKNPFNLFSYFFIKLQK